VLIAAVVIGAVACLWRTWHPETLVLLDPEELPEPLVRAPREPQVGAGQPAGPVVVEPLRPRLADDGAQTVVWEAEWANRVTGSFACLPSEGASGGVALWAREGTGRNNGDVYGPPRNPHLDLGVADYFFELSRGGVFRLFMRVWAADECSNSFWVGIDSGLHYFPGGQHGRYAADNYHWPQEMFRRWLWIDDEGFLYRLKPGPHRLRVEIREDGLAIDQFALVPLRQTPQSGARPPTLLPRWSEWSGGTGLSSDTPSTRASDTTTPFDAFLAVDDHCLASDSAPSATGWLWLRGNTPEPQELTVELACEGATTSPGAEFRCSVSADAPFAHIPFAATFPKADLGSAFDLRATVTSSAYPDLTVERSCRVGRPLDWWVLGPLHGDQATEVEAALAVAGAVDVTRSPAPGMRWIPTQAPAHFNAFGTLDLRLVMGHREHCVAYAVTRIHVERPGSYRLIAAGDDDLRLFCDGQVLVDERGGWPLVDAIRPYPVTLAGGEHLLVVRLSQRSGPWQMLIQFEEAEGKATEDVYGLPLRLE